MKRLLTLPVLVLCGGLAATACNVTPPAAVVNGVTISQSSFDNRLHAFDATQVGHCLMAAETGQTAQFQTAGTGGPGTYNMSFADAILENDVGNTLASQLAASKGLTVSASDLTTAQQIFGATLNGEISAAVAQASQAGTGSYCLTSSGRPLTASQVLAALPAAVRNGLIANNAVDNRLLADGAGITNATVLGYYRANRALFTSDCVSWIVAGTQAAASSYIAQLKGGARFSAVAKAHSLDARTASSGGALGCSYTESQVESALQVSSVTVSKPIGPVQGPSGGVWEIYDVTSQTVAPLSQVRSAVVQQLLQTTANTNRVATQIAAFAHHSRVSVNPEYGNWSARGVVSPVAPPAKYLLAAVSGHPQVPLNRRPPVGPAQGGATG
ncbi:MAG: peptidylprolyl isomerase [Acidimicrobiales bacterium]